MSYDCDNCKKNSVEKPGGWCSECQKIEAMLDAQWEVEWFGKSRLCQQCGNSDGPDQSDKCHHYNMPLWMVARKNKCKHYIELDYELMDDWEDDWW